MICKGLSIADHSKELNFGIRIDGVRPCKRKKKLLVPNTPGDKWKNQSTRGKTPSVGRRESPVDNSRTIRTFMRVPLPSNWGWGRGVNYSNGIKRIGHCSVRNDQTKNRRFPLSPRRRSRRTSLLLFFKGKKKKEKKVT